MYISYIKRRILELHFISNSEALTFQISQNMINTHNTTCRKLLPQNNDSKYLEFLTLRKPK